MSGILPTLACICVCCSLMPTYARYNGSTEIACIFTYHLCTQANIKYEEMREKAGEAVPEGIKEMIHNHGSDVNAEVL